MHFSSLNIPLGVTCILAICATGHPTDTGLKARVPGLPLDSNYGELDVDMKFVTPDGSGQASDLILEITFTNKYDEDILLLEDENSVLDRARPVDVLSWTSSRIGVLPRFRGDSGTDSSDSDHTASHSEQDPKVHTTVKKGSSYVFQYDVGESYDFQSVMPGSYTAQFTQSQFRISIEGKVVEAKANLSRTMIPVEIQEDKESPDTQ